MAISRIDTCFRGMHKCGCCILQLLFPWNLSMLQFLLYTCERVSERERKKSRFLLRFCRGPPPPNSENERILANSFLFRCRSLFWNSAPSGPLSFLSLHLSLFRFFTHMRYYFFLFLSITLLSEECVAGWLLVEAEFVCVCLCVCFSRKMKKKRRVEQNSRTTQYYDSRAERKTAR